MKRKKYAQNGLRHVRDFWQAAQDEKYGLALSEPAVGVLLVTPRLYMVDGRQQIVAGHVGIITEVRDSSILWVHANPRAARVEEVAIRASAPLGAISLAGMFAANFLS
ncbi:MAG TPA: CHAP domain-containing protein [Candidatus Saccharimonadales bacterium]|nr:CHAP domain-containing protein [Candidatus Saccharimonadales bacterium]